MARTFRLFEKVWSDFGYLSGANDDIPFRKGETPNWLQEKGLRPIPSGTSGLRHKRGPVSNYILRRPATLSPSYQADPIRYANSTRHKRRMSNFELAPVESRRIPDTLVELMAISQPPGVNLNDMPERIWNFRNAGKDQVVYMIEGDFELDHPVSSFQFLLVPRRGGPDP
ncbi:hypothetical protein TWF730_008994 [Orbilia blumenaviensis]|uniref:Uncharacterized protein n=1 Tax=Orbilia blumenaviensis TaxID=1796055 RepID=A0AAV9UX23_9PEZI